jgi:hypothetical protein
MRENSSTESKTNGLRAIFFVCARRLAQLAQLDWIDKVTGTKLAQNGPISAIHGATDTSLAPVHHGGDRQAAAGHGLGCAVGGDGA